MAWLLCVSKFLLPVFCIDQDFLWTVWSLLRKVLTITCNLHVTKAATCFIRLGAPVRYNLLLISIPNPHIILFIVMLFSSFPSFSFHPQSHVLFFSSPSPLVKKIETTFTTELIFQKRRHLQWMFSIVIVILPSTTKLMILSINWLHTCNKNVILSSHTQKAALVVA